MQGFKWVLLLAAALSCSGCAVKEKYTSLDLDLLPCEIGDSPRFFHSLEFTANGERRYPAQMDAIKDRFESFPVTDVVVFVHGWSKNPSSAESDYQNFLCRLHGKLRDEIGDRKREHGLLVLGVFWPSTITNRASEPALVKPVSYYRIRNRADRIARTGMQALLAELGDLIREDRSPLPVRVQLIGHSFGGRIVAGSLEELNRKGELVEFLQSAGSVNVLLLNAAVAPDRFLWIPRAIAEARQQGGVARFTEQTNSYLFNIHSLNDSANRRLFPLASTFNDEPAVCAAGACGVSAFATVSLDEAGQPVLPDEPAGCVDARINAWNIDATNVVFSHTDIYKGRIAALLSRLMYDKQLQRRLPGTGANDAGCE